MKWLQKNVLLDLSKMTYRQLGFGERVLNRETFLFKVIVNLVEFQKIIENSFNEFVMEMKEDDENTGEQDIKELFEYNYPSFEQLLQTDRLTLSKVIRDYLFFEFLEGLFGQNDIDVCLYAVNRLDNIEIDSDKVCITGEAYFLSCLKAVGERRVSKASVGWIELASAAVE